MNYRVTWGDPDIINPEEVDACPITFALIPDDEIRDLSGFPKEISRLDENISSTARATSRGVSSDRMVGQNKPWNRTGCLDLCSCTVNSRL